MEGEQKGGEGCPYQLVNVPVCKMHRKVLLHAGFQFNSILQRCNRMIVYIATTVTA